MKFSLICALAMLAIANGSEPVSLRKRDVSSEMDINKSFQDMTAALTKLTQAILENIKDHELTQTAKALIEDGSAQFLPVAEKAHEEARKITEQLKPYINKHLRNFYDLLRPLVFTLLPLADEIQTQLRPFEKHIEPFRIQAVGLIEMVEEQTVAMIPPQYLKVLRGITSDLL